MKRIVEDDIDVVVSSRFASGRMLSPADNGLW